MVNTRNGSTVDRMIKLRKTERFGAGTRESIPVKNAFTITIFHSLEFSAVNGATASAKSNSTSCVNVKTMWITITGKRDSDRSGRCPVDLPHLVLVRGPGSCICSRAAESRLGCTSDHSFRISDTSWFLWYPETKMAILNRCDISVKSESDGVVRLFPGNRKSLCRSAGQFFLPMSHRIAAQKTKRKTK